MELLVGLLVLVSPYLLGAILTARHRVYQIKLSNDGRRYLGRELGPRVYSQQDYFRIRSDFSKRSEKLDPRDTFLPDSDYRDILMNSVLFPWYWGKKIIGKLLETVVFGGIKETPGEAQQRRETRDREIERLQREVLDNDRKSEA